VEGLADIIGRIDTGPEDCQRVTEKKLASLRLEPSAIELTAVEQIIAYTTHIQQHAV
jgi:hypothetical protein